MSKTTKSLLQEARTLFVALVRMRANSPYRSELETRLNDKTLPLATRRLQRRLIEHSKTTPGVYTLHP